MLRPVCTTQGMPSDVQAFEVFAPFETDDEGDALSLFVSETRLVAVLGNGGATIVLSTLDAESFVEHRYEGARRLFRAIQLAGERLLAVGWEQSLWLSADLGVSWTRIFTLGGNWLRDLAQAPDGSIWLCGDDGVVLRGSASLEDFTKVAIASTARLTRVRFLDAQPWFLAADGVLWAPEDNGFTPIAVARAPLTDLIQLDSGELLVTCDDGCVYRRDDAGTPFRGMRINPDGNLDAIAGEGGVLLAVGQHGTVLSSDDNGCSWRRIPIPADYKLMHLFAIALADTGAFVSGEGGLILWLGRREDTSLAAPSAPLSLASIEWPGAPIEPHAYRSIEGPEALAALLADPEAVQMLAALHYQLGAYGDDAEQGLLSRLHELRSLIDLRLTGRSTYFTCQDFEWIGANPLASRLKTLEVDLQANIELADWLALGNKCRSLETLTLTQMIFTQAVFRRQATQPTFGLRLFIAEYSTDKFLARFCEQLRQLPDNALSAFHYATSAEGVTLSQRRRLIRALGNQAAVGSDQAFRSGVGAAGLASAAST